MRTLPDRLELLLTCWGVAFCGVSLGHLCLDWLTPATPMGLLTIAGGVFAALTAGSIAAFALGESMEPPDLAGGGRVLLVAVGASVIAALFEGATWPPGPFWQAFGDALFQRLPWSPLLLAAVFPAAAFRLSLDEDEPFFDGRFRRACGYWLAAWSPPIVAFVLLHPTGTDTIVWAVTLLLPCGLLLGWLGVRLREATFHERGARVRLGLVSAAASAVFVALGTARELAS